MVAVLLGSPAVATAGVVPSELCSGDPCVISVDRNIEAGSSLLLDFGSATVILRSVLDAGDTALTVTAGRFIVENQGQLRGSTITIQGSEEIVLDGTRTTGVIRVVSDFGEVSLISAGAVRGDGDLLFLTTSADDDGGSLTIEVGGDVDLSGRIEATSGGDSSGGIVQVDAGGAVTLDGEINLTGGGFGGGEIEITARGDVTLGAVTLDGTGDGGDGGALSIESGGDVYFGGRVQVRGAATGADSCGDGGDLDVTAQGVLRVGANLDFSARIGDCCGGSGDLEAGRAAIAGDFVLRGPVPNGCGGDLEISTDQDLVCTTLFDLSGTDGGGELDLESLGRLIAQKTCVLDVSGPTGDLNLQAGALMDIAGSARAGRAIELGGCPIEVAPSGSLRTLEADSQNRLTSFSDIAVEGSVVASDANVLRVPVGFSVVVTGSSQPAPTVVVDEGLIPCAALATPTAAETVVPPTSTPGGVATPTPLATTAAAMPSATPTATAQESPTAASCQPPCVGDCNGDCAVEVSDLIRAVRVSLGEASLDTCRAADRNGDGVVTIAELIAAVANALDGCPLALD